MFKTRCWIAFGLLSVCALPVMAQSFRVQCPTNTITHPTAANNNSEPTYVGPTTFTTNAQGFLTPTARVNGAIKCQQISGGDGYATMGDGTQTYMFSFGPLSGVNLIANGQPGTEFPNAFNTPYNTTTNPLPPGYPAVQPANPVAAYNGAIGLTNNVPFIETVYHATDVNHTVTIVLNTVVPFAQGSQVVISGVGPGYNGTHTITKVGVPNTFFAPPEVPNGASYAFQYTVGPTNLAEVAEPPSGTAASVPGLDGHVDTRQVMDVGVMNGNIPAPLFAIDEDDEFFLTLTNVGMIMRPDLFEQHTVHFHGYPNASSVYDGVPDASVAINIGGSFTYYYLAPDAGTYFWHCHITPPEHLQMGMVGQLYVRPRQNRVATARDLGLALLAQQGDLRTACNSKSDILCSNPMPATANPATGATGVTKVANATYAYNDGDGSTRYDVEYPIQLHGFDPNFHFVGMTFNPEGFADMKDKFFMINGRSYPDTVTAGPMQTQSADGVNHFSQPLPAIINIPLGKKALLRISDLNVSEYHTLASLGIPMLVVGYNAKLLRDQAGNNLYYNTNSITLGGGESLDVILDASNTTLYPRGSVFYLYTSNLDHLSNDAENFGGMMTEVHIQ